MDNALGFKVGQAPLRSICEQCLRCTELGSRVGPLAYSGRGGLCREAPIIPVHRVSSSENSDTVRHLERHFDEK